MEWSLVTLICIIYIYVCVWFPHCIRWVHLKSWSTIYIYTRHPETPRKGTFLKKRYLFPSIARIVLLAEESCLEAGGLFLARIYQLRSHFGFSKFLPRQLLRCRCARSCEHLGRCCKLLGRYCSKLRPFLPFGLHIQMICPLLAARTDGCPSVDRSLNVPEIFQSAPWNDQWLEADLAEACDWVRGSKLAPRWKSVFPTGLPFIWSQDIFVDLIGELCSSMQPGEIRRILPTGVEILPNRTRILLNVFRGDNLEKPWHRTKRGESRSWRRGLEQ